MNSGSKQYRVELSDRAIKQLAALESATKERIHAALYLLSSNPRPPRSIKLTNSSEYRIRVGDFRIIYSIDDAVIRVLVLKIKHRRESYR